MCKLLASLCLALFCAGYVIGYMPDDYALYFPRKGVTDYVSIWGMPSLTEFTVCFWMQSSDTTGTPFSYVVKGKDNELLVDFNGDFGVTIAREIRRTGVSANDGEWHHICVIWRNSDGVLRFYKDQVPVYQTENFKTNYIIKGGGALVLGQEQDGLSSGFDASQSLRGSLTSVNVWDHLLSPGQLESNCFSCRDVEAGNVYKWSDFRYGIRMHTVFVVPSPCSPPE